MNHFKEYAYLNDKLLRCIMRNQSDSEEADDIRYQMDKHWKQMSKVEQELMRQRNEKEISYATK